MMKSKLSLSLLKGLLTGALIAPSLIKGETPSEKTDSASQKFLEMIQETNGNITFLSMTKDDLLLELNQDGADVFESLSPEGQELALKLASRSCNGMNDCKAENACRSDKNKCSGQGSCKGQTKCAFSDKNVAVRVAAKKMAEKRQALLKFDSSRP